MARYKVSYEIDTESDSPLESAKEVQEIMKTSCGQFYVQNDDTKEVFSVDLEEDDEDAVLPVTNYAPFIVQL